MKRVFERQSPDCTNEANLQCFYRRVNEKPQYLLSVNNSRKFYVILQFMRSQKSFANTIYVSLLRAHFRLLFQQKVSDGESQMC